MACNTSRPVSLSDTNGGEHVALVVRFTGPEKAISVDSSNHSKERCQMIIAVIGPTGTGKSSFIAKATGCDVDIGHNLEPCTTEIKAFKYQYPREKDFDIILIDSPGFDNEEGKDEKILKMIVEWLNKTYERAVLTGILYVYRISDDRLTDPPLLRPYMVRKLFGETALPSINVTTTMWDDMDSQGGMRAEATLTSHFRGMITSQDSVPRFSDDSPESAQIILDSFIDFFRKQQTLGKQVAYVAPGAKKGIREKIKGLKLFFTSPKGIPLDTEGFLDDQIIVVIMGQTGAGRSSFVAAATGSHDDGIGHDLRPCTTEMKIVKVTKYECFDKSDFEVVFVETPGFNNGTLPDVEILKVTAEWLNKTYGKRIILAGILYFHPVSDTRMTGTPVENIHIFRKSVWDQIPYNNIIFTTTMWNRVEEEVGVQREAEVLSKYWKGMIDEGSTTERFLQTQGSAWNILGRFVREANARHAEFLEKELSEMKNLFGKTDAAQKLYTKFEGLVRRQQATLKEIRELTKDNVDSVELDALKVKYNSQRKKLAVVLIDMESLKLPLGKHLLRLIWGPKFGSSDSVESKDMSEVS